MGAQTTTLSGFRTGLRAFPSRSLRNAFLFLVCAGCASSPVILVPPGGYSWPSTDRDYWPTTGWRNASPSDHGVDSARLEVAEEFARQDPLARCVLLVKDGYVVFERYYGDGAVDRSINLWSVTKSFTSALVGILFTRGQLDSVDLSMVECMPDYPAFGDITIRHALTQTTGLRWSEEGRPWVDWILSADWIAAALARGSDHAPGEFFRYSSANTHFLCGLIRAVSGRTPGELAQADLFRPLGIPFRPAIGPPHYRRWDDYKVLLDHGWHRDPTGLETGGFGLCLTARDMAKLGFLYLNRGVWDGEQVLSRAWVEESTRDQRTDIRGRYSYGYQWWIARVDGLPCFLASGFGGQIIGVVPSLDAVVVLTYESEDPVHPVAGTAHDDIGLLEMVIRAVGR